MMRELQERTRYIASLVRERGEVFTAWQSATGEAKLRLWHDWKDLTGRIERAQNMSAVVDSQRHLFEAVL